MRSVQSTNDLKNISLRNGNPVNIGAGRFNTSGEKLSPIARIPKSEVVQPKVDEPPKETQVTVDMKPVADAQERFGQMVVNAIAQSQQQEQQKPIPYRFTVHRNEKGQIDYIDAHPLA